MAAASGAFLKVARKRETTYGVLAGAAGAALMRRVKAQVDLTKQTYKSNEIRPDLQVADYRHGVRSVPASVSGELSPGAYSDEISSVLKRDFAAVAAISGAGITIAAGALNGGLQTYSVTRAAGSFLTDGVKIGDVLRLSVGTFNAANLAKNLWVIGLTATIATVLTLNGSALVAEGPISGSTVTVFGKKTFVPTTGHTAVSYSLEKFFSDIAQSEVYTGIRYSKLDIQLPPTGIATIALSGTGKDLGQTGTSQYFTSPTALTTTGVTAAVNGIVMLNGVAQAVITGLQITGDAAFSGDPVVGANTVPAQFAGPVSLTGQASMQFVDNVARDLFVNETECSLMVVLTSDNTAASSFVAITLPRVKLGGASKDDSPTQITQTLPYQALIALTGGAGTIAEQTSIVVQDSDAA